MTETNINPIFEEKIYQVPKWGMQLLSVVSLVVSIGFGFAGLKYPEWGKGHPEAFEYFFYVISVGFFLAFYRLISWKSWVYFKADQFGIRFPCPKLQSCSTEYLFVPWKNIKNIRLEQFRSDAGGTTKGVALDIKISKHERDEFFPSLLLQEFKEWTTIGFTDAFLNKKKTMTELINIKAEVN